jgi:5-methyltetrahydropteroyltriglutamate--homocysteine methyltransferase
MPGDRAVTTDHTAPAAGPATILGYPRIGPERQTKRAVEGYWAGRLDAAELLATTARLRRDNWRALAAAGLSEVPCNDFSLYDHMLDMVQMLDAVPARHRTAGDTQDPQVRLDEYFAMARGDDGAAPLEMTKWFDTNYHYLVPELDPETTFRLRAEKVLGELREAQAVLAAPRPVLVGPLTFLLLSKPARGVPAGFDPLTLLDRLVPVYAELLAALADQGAAWVQLDEPILVTDQPERVLDATARAYGALGAAVNRPRLLVATYFDALGAALPVLRDAPIEGVAMDFSARAAGHAEQLAAAGGLPGKRLVAGVVDGRNVWVNDLSASLSTLASLTAQAGEVVPAPSCSLLHVPLDVRNEPDLDPTVASWLAFATQKIDETVTLATALRSGSSAGERLDANRAALASRAASPFAVDPAVRARVRELGPDDERRAGDYAQRVAVQRERLALPLLPTTTIGSFPQTSELRAARARLRAGELDADGYAQVMRAEIDHVIALQESAGLDVLVHGEPERNDMVQYFAEQLDGFIATRNGWVQSYGSRYVRPPIVAGDVSRPRPMTVEWATYAQSRTTRPLKGMLTGPVTMLCWSFVRDDQPLGDTALQVALALRDEVGDLEAAGLPIIQVDEPALREGLPLRAAARPEYLAWATRAFRVATGGVRDATQIHTHMCYAEFGEILDAVAALDADVISLEAARSDMQIVRELAAAGYPAAVGPGVYDVHAPHVPEAEEMAALLRRAVDTLPAERIWVNPDCGLKTRREAEIAPSLTNMVQAARWLRAAGVS